ncbi:DNA polymerase III subunit beta [Clostridium chrysemydis]|uniref:DNA polymerase III subunit beta n=1 Tax=Clostridium chrysemydis TaxID=2665504 RepID=UPI001883BEC9|nr:DNA polymerase III subunit beta [Clostridium chrysemydis]
MKFTCQKQKLLEGISIVQKAITGKSTMSVLEGIYLHCVNDNLVLIGSDMDVSIETNIDVDVKEEGSIVIDAKIFSEIIRKLPNSEIEIETMQNETIQITCEKSVFNVVYMKAEEFPELPTVNEGEEVTVPQNILKSMIKATSFAIAQDETRPILQGILFEIKDKNINLVALDGYRLAIKSEYIDSDLEKDVVIPGKTLNEVSKILEDSEDLVKITFTKNHILFTFEKTRVISRLLEGKFVNYKSLLPEEHKLEVLVDKQEFQNGIERASLMAKDGNNNLVKFEVEDESIIISSNSQLGKVREEVTINLQGEKIQIAFNSRYLLDVLKNLDEEEIVLEMTSSVSPCIIKGKEVDNYRYLVLPVRLIR